MKIDVTIKGRTPLLMHAFNPEDLGKTLKSSIKKEEEERARIAEKHTYRMPDGTLYIPGRCIYSAIVDAGRFHKKGKQQVTTRDRSLICGSVLMLDTYCSLHTKDYIIDSQAAVNQTTKGRIMTHRPCLEKWKVSFSLKIDDFFSENEIRAFVDDAGRRCGLLAFRPNRKGIYGQFDVVKWEVAAD